MTSLTRRTMLLGTLAVPAGLLLARRARAASIVYDAAQLRAALLAAVPGDVIELAPGDYTGLGKLVIARGEITLRALTPLTAVLRFPLLVTGPRVTVEGLVFERAGVELAGHRIHLTRCRLRGEKGYAVRITSGDEVRVSYCEICEFGRGIGVKLPAKGAPTAPRIDHNHLHDARGGASGGEAIQLAEAMKDSDKWLGAVVEHNLLERVEAESEAISVKCSGNLIRQNTLRDSRANLVNRHGEGNTYEGNTLERAFSIVIHDRGNNVIGNRCVSPLQKRSIRIMGGNISASLNKQGSHPQATDTVVAGNVADHLIVGDLFKGHTLPAVGTIIAGHGGAVIMKTHTGTVMSPDPVPVAPAIALMPGDVGPLAPPPPPEPPPEETPPLDPPLEPPPEEPPSGKVVPGVLLAMQLRAQNSLGAIPPALQPPPAQAKPGKPVKPAKAKVKVKAAKQKKKAKKK